MSDIKASIGKWSESSPCPDCKSPGGEMIMLITDATKVSQCSFCRSVRVWMNGGTSPKESFRMIAHKIQHALDEQSCPVCSAELRYNPSTAHLECPDLTCNYKKRVSGQRTRSQALRKSRYTDIRKIVIAVASGNADQELLTPDIMEEFQELQEQVKMDDEEVTDSLRPKPPRG